MTDEFEYRKGWLVKQSFSNEFVKFLVEMYNKYGEEIFAIQGISNKYMDIANFSKNFFSKSNVADVTSDSNANVKEKNIVQYNYENSKSLMKLNNLYRLYKGIKKYFTTKDAEECIEKLINGELFINDLSNFAPYCYAFDLRELMEYGMPFMGGGLNIKKPKYSDSFINLIIQSTAYISNQIAGACSFPDFFVCLNKFYEQELGEEYTLMIDDCSTKEKFKHPIRTLKFAYNKKRVQKKIRNQFQNLIYSLNFPFRGNQSPFSNLSVMDMGFMKSLFDGYQFYDGVGPSIENSYKLSKFFYEYLDSIQCKEGMFTFPVSTLAISVTDDDKRDYIDPDFVKWVSKINCTKSIANCFIDVPTSFSSCCRLTNNFAKVAEEGYQNSFGVGGLSIGSHRVAGLNLPRIAILERTDEDVLVKDLECLRRILYAHRMLIEKNIKDGFLPLYDHNWIHLRKQYSTIGFIGAFEYVKNKGQDMMTDGKETVKQLLLTIENKAQKWKKDYKEKGKHIPYNIEQIPGESVAVRLATIDKILGFNKDYDLYSNQYIPLTENESIYNRIVVQGEIDQYTSGGAILHINVDDEKPLSAEQYYNLIETARQKRCKYFAVNYCYSEDEEHNYIIGKHTVSPINGSKIINIYSRVVGFITPVSAWNKTRREGEFPNRHFYKNSDTQITE